MTYIVKRRTGKYWIDTLTGFDPIWGPVWSSGTDALRFETQEQADVAMFDAMDIMRPKAWCVPNYGGATTLWTEEV